MTADPDLGRRAVLRAGAGAAAGLSAFALLGKGAQAQEREVDEVDYIVIGSGPGGAPLAANLAEAGFDVLVLEAGPPEGNKLFYEVPSFSNMAAAADEMIRWDYYVQHYSDLAFNKTDTKWVHGHGGVLYPRASTIGGCTAHHAMITMYPEHSDWAYIQQLTGDDSWAPDAMWRHWQEGVLSWLNVEYPPLEVVNIDGQLAALTAAAKAEAEKLRGGDVVTDPKGINKRENVDKTAQGFFYTPQATRLGRRRGPRERLLAAAREHPQRLSIITDALAEKIVLEKAPDGRQRAVGVEYLAGRHLYGASPRYRPTTAQERAGMRRTVRVRSGGEVIVAGGAYGSPQLLMLSGIGPKEHLTQFGIPVKIDLPGVGTNLQDRYEVPVVSQHQPFYALSLCTYNKGVDPCLMAWEAQNSLGLNALGYGFNGIIAGIKSRYGGGKHGELFVFGGPVEFRGYQPGFDSGYIHERFTWWVLKGYSDSRIGTVRLRSPDPTRPPAINKRNFNDGAGGQRDLAAILEGVALARRINKLARTGTEIWPGPSVTEDDLGNWVKREAWGHHASCTNPIGPAGNRGSVLDGKFRVHGTANLRVVDASAFPRIPGLFIWAPTAILSEKASKDILAAADRRVRNASRTRP